jgi:hypothetical protein
LAQKPPRYCARCKIDVSPRWWKAEDSAVRPLLNVSRDDKGMSSTNSTESNGHARLENAPQLQNSEPHNGCTDYPMRDAPSVVSQEQPSWPGNDGDLSVVRSVSYLCQKCHWKKINGAEESPEREKSLPALHETQQLPVRSPPLPPPPLGHWMPPVPHAPQHQHPPPPVPMWHGNNPPPLAHPLHNGIVHPAHAVPPLGHPPSFHAPYNPMHQPNGYPPFSGPPMHPQMPPSVVHGHGHYSHPPPPPPPPPQNGPPAPPHLNGNGLVVNGVHSPHLPYSSAHPHGHGVSRTTESPFPTPPPLQQYSLHHGSPPPGSINNRPATPRDTVMRDTPAVAPVAEQRASTGASASPSLRNLLH